MSKPLRNYGYSGYGDYYGAGSYYGDPYNDPNYSSNYGGVGYQLIPDPTSQTPPDVQPLNPEPVTTPEPKDIIADKVNQILNTPLAGVQDLFFSKGAAQAQQPQITFAVPYPQVTAQPSINSPSVVIVIFSLVVIGGLIYVASKFS